MMGTQDKIDGICAPVCLTLVMPLYAIIFTKGSSEGGAGAARALYSYHLLLAH